MMHHRSCFAPPCITTTACCDCNRFAVPFLIGVTLDVGNGSFIKEEVSERKNIDGTRFDPGDFAIAVRWLERVDGDEQQRSFEFSRTDGSQFVISSTELRHS